MSSKYDAIIIGSGSNGLAAAIRLQRLGLRTAIYEQAATPGGATRTEELTLPGFKHDVGSAILPMGVASPFFSQLPLKDFGLEWIYPDIPYAHPFSDGTAFACYEDLYRTAAEMGEDERAYLKIFESIVKNWDKLGRNCWGQ